jgi:uncharacterized membrane protein
MTTISLGRGEAAPRDMTCPVCGGANAEDAIFCANPECGKALGGFRYVAEEVRARARWHERIADHVVSFVGRSHFIVVHVGWFALWVLLNTGVVALAMPFDAYPFGLLGLLLSVEAILLSGFLLISQNRERQQEAIQAEIDYEISVRTHRRVEEIERLLREVAARLSSIEERIGRT